MSGIDSLRGLRAVLHLVMDDEGDDMNDQEREALDRILLASFESAKAGELCPASILLDDLRHQR